MNEAIVKKRKLNNEVVELADIQTSGDITRETTSRTGITDREENSIRPQPQLIMKDGKVQLSMPQLVQERSQQIPLEVVKFNRKKVTTSSSFRNTIHTEKWTPKETKKFYRVLSASFYNIKRSRLLKSLELTLL